MFSLDELLGSAAGANARDEISRNLGAGNDTVSNAISIALPAILGGLARSTGDDAGAQSLNNALERDHDGSLLDDLTSYLGGGVPAPQQATRQTDGSGILEHILGGSSGSIANEISNRTGLNAGQAANLLITLAPIVMAYLGRRKKQEGLDAGSLSDLISGQAAQASGSGNPIFDMASAALDRDHDGSALDDLASMAADYFMK